MKYLKKYIISTFIAMVAILGVRGQDSGSSLGFWHLNTLSGEVGFLGNYRTQSTLINDLQEQQDSRYIQGRFKLNTDSYLWKNDIFRLNLNGEYNPELRDEKYLIVPDRSEVRTLTKLDYRATIFADKKININTFGNFTNSYFNRENLTNVKSNNKLLGGQLSFNNKILPFTIHYRKSSWEQSETDSGRSFRMNQKSLEGRATSSFYGNDRHELKYSLKDYKYQYSDLNEIANIISRIDLNNQFYFDENRNYSLNSNISYYDQSGTYSFKRVEANERALLHLPQNFNLLGAYNFYLMDNPGQSVNVNNLRASVKHKLFESLNSQIYINYSNTNHTVYKESSLKGGAIVRYTKKTFFGRLNLGYNYFRQRDEVTGDPSSINILREEHNLNDLDISILSRPYVDHGSVMVTDITSTIIYQEGLDYIVNSINDFTEILRIPGGQISQNQQVLISYTSIQPGSYNFTANNHTFTSSLSFMNRLLEIYYHGASQAYSDFEQTEYLTLNRYYQNLFGARIYYKFITAGIEYDYYNSELIPYERIKYYLNLNIRVKSNMLFSLNGNIRDYKVIDTGIDHLYTNLSARFTYAITPRTRFNLESGYLNQSGRSINLNLITGKAEIATNIRNLVIKGNINIYQRRYSNSKFIYTGTYIEIIRKF